ncbi:PREDICTED: protein SAD1/UNC-84 domain protein 1-like isoform X2 [Nelumbo nucifera]|uniref:Protein SAD1/UNC-84 domain protein 1-like isoform X2 n=2 Tax=Nelumbo nucifera TaxID=4432 RepID=A0A1U8QBZ6_NELNU|nr:PREDICTED: protein SAD1/UNC-84 domain protein 1-like isoform X2 [Nelumbo nucifera]DAD47233.1 TPA_asm: hypothetical protein HUJ06_017170 [Nelumbo nucifera]
MSASTVAIAANPAVSNSPSLALASKPNARRRAVVVTEKKSGIEMVAEGAVSETGDEKGGNGKDLSHSIRGETVLEKPKDLLQSKRNLVNSTVSPRRTRKVVLKPEKPRWMTVVSIFTKNFVLLLVLLGLVQMIRKLALKNENSGIPQAGALDFEGRVAEVEEFVKTTTNMMQVQVDVLDKKIHKVEEKGNLLEGEVKKLEDRTDRLDASLQELRDTDFFPKEDFHKFADELKKSNSLKESYKQWSLDEIKAIAREIVRKEVEKHAADGLARVDYALASGGGMVVRHSEPYIPGSGRSWFLATGRNRVHSDAQKMLQPSFGEPGHCFPLAGSKGFVEIKLRTVIVPEAVTLEHVTKSKCSKGLSDLRMVTKT